MIISDTVAWAVRSSRETSILEKSVALLREQPGAGYKQ